MIAIYKSKYRECQISDDDKIWMARMCLGEGGRNCSHDKASAMLWAIMYRWHLWDRNMRYNTYVDLMRAFSQPINPRWRAGGDLADRWMGTPFATPARLARRAWISSRSWDKIPAKIREAVLNFQTGELFPPEVLTTIDRARITNWASLKSTPRKFPWGVDIDGDWFFEDNNIRDGIVLIEKNESKSPIEGNIS